MVTWNTIRSLRAFECRKTKEPCIVSGYVKKDIGLTKWSKDAERDRQLKISQKMKVEIFSLCDFACVDAGGKITIVGVFDAIYGREAPVMHGLCALAIRVRFDGIEEGNKKFKISFTDTDGNAIMPSMETQIPVRLSPNASTASAQVVSIMSQIKLANFGEYSIDLAIDGRHEASTPLYVREIPKPEAPPDQE